MVDQLVVAQTTYQEAQLLANSSTHLGILGYLATITSAQEVNFILENYADFNQTSFFLGASDVGHEGTSRK